MSRIVLTLICGPVWRAGGDKSWCQVLVILADFGHADRNGWCQNELPLEVFSLYVCRCLPLCLSPHFIVFLYASHHLFFYLPTLPSDGPHPTPSRTPFLSLLQLIAALADYFIQCGPLRASSPGFGRALISHVNIPFIGLNITQHLPPSQRPPGSPCPVRTADYWEG